MDRGLKPKRPALAGGKRRPRIFGSLWLAGAALLLFVGALPAGAAPEPSAQRDPIRVLAHYYIWFDPSWIGQRPITSRRHSATRRRSRQHRWAGKGIDGLSPAGRAPCSHGRLDELVEVAEEGRFSICTSISGASLSPWIVSSPDMDYFARAP
jgi:hypothetical protein